jgi:hypothetical protein
MATTRVTTFASLVEGYQHTDPKLYQILQGFVQALGEVQAELNPIVKQITDTAGTIAAPSTAPTFISYEILNKRILRIYWSGATNAASYEIRKGTTGWDAATFITGTNQLEVRLDPLLVGSHTYLVRSKNGLGIYSDTYATIVVDIPAIGTQNITAQVIDNNVLLRFSKPVSTWEIDHYDIYRNNLLVGEISSEFFVWFESTGGTFTYGVESVDLAGNRGPRASCSANVNQPPDFELIDSRFSLLSGTKINALVFGEPILGWDYTDTQGWPTSTTWAWISDNTGKLLVCINTTELYNAHFTSHSWNSPNDQVVAGYPVYIQPGALTAQYQEVIDYGAVFNNIILNLSWLLQQVGTAGLVQVAPTIEFSTDNATWTAPVNGASAYGVSFRYARITFNFTATQDKALAIFSNLAILLDVKYEMDSGFVNALSADSGGTVVTFNKTFKDIDSITVTPTKQPEPLMAIYDFVDVPNPVSFKVLVFDSIGSRVTSVVSWKARGVT